MELIVACVVAVVAAALILFGAMLGAGCYLAAAVCALVVILAPYAAARWSL